MLLAGDIGGTKTILAIYASESVIRAPLHEESFPSARYPDLKDIVHAFLAGKSQAVDRAVFGVSGPVVKGTARITNLPWILEEQKLGHALNLKTVYLLNDLEALAYAVPILESEDLLTLNKGNPVAEGTIAVIAPGTGLGEAFLTFEKGGANSRYRSHPSEGGHADFAPIESLENELLEHLRKRISHVSYEKVCSGPGISEIYNFLKTSGYGKETEWVSVELSRAEDPTPVIVKASFNEARPSKLCRKTIHLFTSILGAEAGNLALKVLATGGVYIGGGIAPAIVPALKQGPFLHRFKNKGRMSDLLARMPVHVITNPKAALLGTAYFGLHRLCEE
jgi:glucokinase